jgi:hypothetical protein
MIETHAAVGGRAWNVLDAHYREISKIHLRELFAGDPTRG